MNAAAPASSSVLLKPSLEDGEHRLMARERLAEVEVQQDVPEIQAVLDVPRRSRPKFRAHRLDGRGRDGGVLRHLVQEVAGGELQQDEGQRRNPE